jgi:glycosyltransferase involved in cell wall biosynthesis
VRVTFLNTGASLGGAERSLLDLLASLRAGSPELRVSLVTGAEGPLVHEARDLGVETRILPFPDSLARIGDSTVRGLGGRLGLAGRTLGAGLDAWRYRRVLARTLDELAPDVVHSNTIKLHLFGALANRRGRPLVWHVRDMIGLRPVAGRALRWAASRAALAFVISRAVADDARSTLGALPLEILYDGIDTRMFEPGAGDSDRLDSSCGLPPCAGDVVRIGLVAAFATWKGHDTFLEAASRVTDPRIRFYVVGGPIYATAAQVNEAALRERARGLGIASRVGWSGFRDDVANVYRALDVVVHASTRPEPFGRTIVEAMACGRAVIVSRAGGAAELFEEGQDAIGFRPGDAADLARAMIRLAGDPAERERLGARARATAVERFSRERLAPAVLRAYERLLGASGASRGGRL